MDLKETLPTECHQRCLVVTCVSTALGDSPLNALWMKDGPVSSGVHYWEVENLGGVLQLGRRWQHPCECMPQEVAKKYIKNQGLIYHQWVGPSSKIKPKASLIGRHAACGPSSCDFPRAWKCGDDHPGEVLQGLPIKVWIPNHLRIQR